MSLDWLLLSRVVSVTLVVVLCGFRTSPIRCCAEGVLLLAVVATKAATNNNDNKNSSVS